MPPGRDTVPPRACGGVLIVTSQRPTRKGAIRPTGIERRGSSQACHRSCVVVGAGDTNSTGTHTAAFAGVWNGKTWAVTKWGGPTGDTEAELVGVSCTSAVRCMAVGAHGTAKAAAPAAFAWGGSKWTVLKVAGPGAAKAAEFAGISCPVSGKCLTTGATGKANGSTATPIAGYWNGSAWKYGPMFPAA